MRNISILVIALQCLQVFVSSEEHGREKRALNMLRMGKRTSILTLPPLVPPNYNLGDEFEERELLIPDGEPRQIWIPRVGKDIDYEGRFVRAPPFPRLGKVYDDYLQEFRRELGDEELRQFLLKYPHHSRSKRSIDDGEPTKKSDQKRALPRLGLRDESVMEEIERAAPLPRLGLLDRAAPLPRLGLRDFEDYYFNDDNEVERAAPLPRLGLREEERAMPLPRMGYMDKRAMGMLRMGRSDSSESYEEEKRALGMLRMGKRAMSMLRMGRSPEVEHENEKRALNMLRMGKRAIGMLRMGRSDGSETEEKRAFNMLRMGKRAMGMLRMGRSDNTEEEKRAMGMLRMGRSDNSEEEKRAMGMLRMGKRPMSMLRMGRSELEVAPEETKRAMGMLRMGKRPISMLRMGKRDTEAVAEHHNEKAHS